MSKKNILFLMTDQQRLDHIGYHPNAKVKTPNLDRIAEGAAFSQCYSANPVCTPMRTALITGRYTHQIGTLRMAGDLSRQHPTFMRALQKDGYHTVGIGKFHYMQTWPWNTKRGKRLNLHGLKEEIKEYGFDEVWETAGKQLMVRSYCDYAHYLAEKGLLNTYLDFVEAAGPNNPRALGPDEVHNADTDSGKPFPLAEEDYMDVLTADQVIKHITERPKDKPFYIYGSFCSPHKPFDPPQRYLDMVEYEEEDDFIPSDEDLTPEAKKHLWMKRRAYKAMMLLIDDQVGRIFEALEDEGILDDTVILFTTDHGEMLGDHGRLQKSLYYKEAVNVPCAIRHPDYLTGKVFESPIETNDLAATVLDVAGLNAQEALSEDWPGFRNVIPCKSLMPMLRGETDAIRDFAFSECSNDWELTTDGHYKYVRFLNYDTPGNYRELLFDMDNDPDELSDVSSDPQCAEILQKLRDARDFVKDTTPPAQTTWAPLNMDD